MTKLAASILLPLVVWAPVPITVCKSGCAYSDLQKAVDDAVAGWRIRPQAGETFTRNQPLLLDNDLTDWVVIESSRIDELREGYRVFPKDAPLMPRIVTSDTGNGGVFLTKTTAHHWALVGLEITFAGPGQTNDGELIVIGDTSKETREDLTSHDILIDRCYIHGYPNDQGPQRAVLANGNQITVSNSYFDEIHLNAGNQETHLIGLFAAGDDLLVYNNSLIGGTEGSLTGGGRDPVNNRRPHNVRIVGNYYFFPGQWITYNLLSDPEGNTLPTKDLKRSQTFLDLDGADDTAGTADDYTFLVWTEKAWRKVGQPLGKDEPRYYPGSMWRNQATGKNWNANAEGTRYVAGAADVLAPYLAKPITAVTPGNPTVLTLSYNCAELFVGNCSEGPSRLMNTSMLYSGGEGPWAALNGKKLLHTRVSSTQISIPFNSTGFPSTNYGKLTGTPQFLWWPQKNGAEWKTGKGHYFAANTIRNRWPVTMGNQKGNAFLWNWLPDQDGANAILQDSYFGNNKILDTTTGVALGMIQWDYKVSGSNIGTGTTTKLYTGSSMFQRRGEPVYLSGGTGDFADLANPTEVYVTQGHNEGLPFGTLYVSYNSTGKSTSGVTLRVYDAAHLRSASWPRSTVVDNNLFEIATVPVVNLHGIFQSIYDTGAASNSAVVGQAFAWQWSGSIRHNTVIRRSFGPEFWPNTFIQTTGLAMHTRTGPADTWPPTDIRILSNLDDGAAGRFVSDQNSSDGCNDALSKYWGIRGSRLEMAGNVVSFDGIWQSGISSTEYNNPICAGGLIYTWGREDGFATTEADGSVTVSGGKATFGWKAAARLLPGAVFCVTGSEPANLKGCYRAPQGITETSTSWSNVLTPNVPNGTYKNVTVSSGIRYMDYANRNYRLHPDSPVRGLGHDGADPGADLNVVDWSTEKNISGEPNPYLSTWITSITREDTTATVCYVAYDTAPVTLTVAATRRYEPDIGTDSEVERRGRQGCTKITGLQPKTHYYARLHTGGRYRDTFEMDGVIAEFTTRPSARASTSRASRQVPPP